jgi:ABC-type transporter Mla subunit MlaD
MLSKKQKAIYLATGGVAAATFVWLRNAESASRTRRFLNSAGAHVKKTLGDIQTTLVTIRERTEEIDRIVHELARVGSENKGKAEVVFDDTLSRLDQTSKEITGLITDVRTAVKQAIAPKHAKAA